VATELLESLREEISAPVATFCIDSYQGQPNKAASFKWNECNIVNSVLSMYNLAPQSSIYIPMRTDAVTQFNSEFQFQNQNDFQTCLFFGAAIYNAFRPTRLTGSSRTRLNTLTSALRQSDNGNICTLSLAFPFDVDRFWRESKTRDTSLQTRSLLSKYIQPAVPTSECIVASGLSDQTQELFYSVVSRSLCDQRLSLALESPLEVPLPFTHNSDQIVTEIPSASQLQSRLPTFSRIPTVTHVKNSTEVFRYLEELSAEFKKIDKRPFVNDDETEDDFKEIHNQMITICDQYQNEE